jgi:hypothetical protein
MSPRLDGFLPLDVVRRFEPIAAARRVSEVARSPRGFLSAYKKARGNPAHLPLEWHQKRRAFIARHMAQVKMRREPLYDRYGEPTRRALALIMWAYFPGGF